MGIADSLKKGTVELLILQLLCNGEMYGYELSQALQEQSGGTLSIQEGSLYPTLYRLTDFGYITDRKEQVGKRRIRIYYSLTPEGRERLNALVKEYLNMNRGILKVLGRENFYDEEK